MKTHLDEFLPEWQFGEYHRRRIDAPPDRVFAAIKAIRADEIFLFRTLTFLRRGGRKHPQGILNPGTAEPILDVATRTGFITLADDPPRELVVGTIVIGCREPLTAEVFHHPPPGVAIAAMNFLVLPDGSGRSHVSTETRIHTTSPSARRRFGLYWRLIYPGSAFIRLMWLRAIAKRAER